MQDRYLDDAAFLTAFEDGSLPPARFDHRAHVRAAWLYLRQHSLPEAAQRCARTIQRYAARQGAPDKFHLTLTLAFMHIIHDLMRGQPGDDFAAFLAHNPDLLAAPRRLLARHYSDDQLALPHARAAFVEPDRMPLP